MASVISCVVALSCSSLRMRLSACSRTVFSASSSLRSRSVTRLCSAARCAFASLICTGDGDDMLGMRKTKAPVRWALSHPRQHRTAGLIIFRGPDWMMLNSLSISACVTLPAATRDCLLQEIFASIMQRQSLVCIYMQRGGLWYCPI